MLAVSCEERTKATIPPELWDAFREVFNDWWRKQAEEQKRLGAGPPSEPWYGDTLFFGDVALVRGHD